MKKKTKIIILACIVAAVAIVAILLFINSRSSDADNTAIQTKILSQVTLADTISVTGTVESNDRAEVYSPIQTLPVLDIFVGVGDHVEAGDILCELNTDSLENNIAQSNAQISNSDSTSAQTVASNQMKYDNAVYNLNNGLNAQVNSAGDAVRNAETAVNRANAALAAAQTAIPAAQTALDQAQADYNTNPDQANLDALTEAQSAFSDASKAMATAATTAADAQTAYQNTWSQYTITLNAANQDIETYRKTLESSQIAANTGTDSQKIALKELKAQLAQAKITAPISGTVMEVHAIKGGASSGVLFVIQNTNDLRIRTTIKQYDVNRVSTGMDVFIQSDSTGDDVYEGKLISIAPLPLSPVSAASGSDVVYEAEIAVTSSQTALRIGMSARMDIILAQVEHVIAVPYDAVAESPAGEKIVYVAIKSNDDKTTRYQAIPVITGMETDFYIEVSGKDLKEGMSVVSNPELLTAEQIHE
ncbi:MAG: HlyD family efflux transporter periplasmic adaptor subunit [Clostridiales Family XIII bacterium]|jgi:multidrug efflux pump subunit AcrA (membrane-fusion protein)|nr:HlyD family efflux transporter periplasmic adaptor subunit [Clostridiales Family XIII bacterium]